MAASDAILMEMIWLDGVLRSSRRKIWLESFAVLLCAISAYWHSLVPRRAETAQPSSLVSLSPRVGRTLSFLAVFACAFSLTPNTRPVSLFTAHAGRNISSAHTCNELSVRFHVSAHHACGHAGNTGNKCADAAASLGMKAFVSENNVPVFRPECDIFVQRLFEVLHRLTQIAEVLHSMVVQSQPV